MRKALDEDRHNCDEDRHENDEGRRSHDGGRGEVAKIVILDIVLAVSPTILIYYVINVVSRIKKTLSVKKMGRSRPN